MPPGLFVFSGEFIIFARYEEKDSADMPVCGSAAGHRQCGGSGISLFSREGGKSGAGVRGCRHHGHKRRDGFSDSKGGSIDVSGGS